MNKRQRKKAIKKKLNKAWNNSSLAKVFKEMYSVRELEELSKALRDLASAGD